MYTKPMLKKDYTIPCEFEKEFFTQTDFQEQVLVIVQQGQEELAEDNCYIGDFTI